MPAVPPAVTASRSTAAAMGVFLVTGGLISVALASGTDVVLDARGLGLLALGAVAAATGAAMLAVGHRVPPAGYHAVVGLGTALITAAALLMPSATTALAVGGLYTFIVVDVVYFFSRRQAAAHLASVAVAGGTALGLQDVPVGILVSLGLIGAALTYVVGALVQRASTASRDSLTGLCNRRGFDDAVEAAVVTAERSGTPLSAALLDVDHFKTVNDRGGHAAGDQLLRAIADQAAPVLPAGAVLARFGGDEFAVLLPGRSGAQAQDLVDRLRGAVTAAGLSAGVAELRRGHSAADLLRHADTALYAAKAAGRGRSRLHDDASTDTARDLADALGRGHVRAWFQPLVSLAGGPGGPGGEVVGFEALARWVRPDGRVVPPAEFIPAAETSGLIGELGLAVLADACRGAREVRDAWGRDLLLTVNVSGRELTSGDYPDRVHEILRATGWPTDLLVVEVTESLVDGSSAQALAALDELRARGVAVAIDDFGTGYSAFSRLDTLPADYLKLDNVFMADITTSPRRAGMLQALLSLARALGLQVVAEGVETREQADLLTAMGCTLAQGWLFGRPVPPAELAATPPVPVDRAAQWLAGARDRR
ncbi:putative bifunctional diguanylate cyclase/phosphodiesterase [Kineococcus sp. SYSU DK002]|uniref:putative bifunctional diguanylate cyclase/phosphodiesterase n=1 Tax=Kineococcus sp. SYSU DK002 TaxID=3383123 RepID=UPI003D7DBE21